MPKAAQKGGDPSGSGEGRGRKALWLASMGLVFIISVVVVFIVLWYFRPDKVPSWQSGLVSVVVGILITTVLSVLAISGDSKKIQHSLVESLEKFSASPNVAAVSEAYKNLKNDFDALVAAKDTLVEIADYLRANSPYPPRW